MMMNSTDIVKWFAESPSNSSSLFQFDATSGSEVTSGDPSASHFVIHPAAMLGGLSVQTVSFILLGVGAAAPILLVTSVAVVLKLRRMRRRRQYSKYVFDHEDDCKDAWYEHGSDGEPVQRKAVNGNKPVAVASFSDETRRKESSFNAADGVPCEGSVGRYPLSSHDLDSVIKTFFGLTRGDSPSSSTATEKRSSASSTQAPLKNPTQRSEDSDRATHFPTKSSTTLLNVRALVERSERNDSRDTGDFSHRIPGAGKIQMDYPESSGRLGIPIVNPTGRGIPEESSNGKLGSSDSIRRSVDSSISCRSETLQIFFQAEDLSAKTSEEEEERWGNGNISGSQSTSVYFDADSSPNATPKLDPDAEVRHSASSSTVYSSHRQVAAVVPVFGVEEEQVLRCLDEVLLEYMDHSDDSETRTDLEETSTSN